MLTEEEIRRHLKWAERDKKCAAEALRKATSIQSHLRLWKEWYHMGGAIAALQVVLGETED